MLSVWKRFEQALARKGCRCLWHYVAGFLTAFWGIHNDQVMAGGISLFVVYQVWQDVVKRRKRRRDSYKDIAEFTIGWFIGIATRWIIWQGGLL